MCDYYIKEVENTLIKITRYLYKLKRKLAKGKDGKKVLLR
ncbi:MAG: DUF2200 family protein [Flavipsychrobacter sp.]|nr:DUF2200 family protein [Flavipsychrobacter sp.]